MVLNLLTVFWGILLLVNFKKFFIVFMAFAVWISCFFSPTASVFPAVSMVAFVLFLINYKKMTQNVMVTKFPMMLSFVLLFTQVSEVKIQYSMPSVQVGLVMPFCDCQQ